MFERIKAYRKVKEMDKCLKSIRGAAVLFGDDELVQLVNDTLEKNRSMKFLVLCDRKMAIKYINNVKQHELY